jgi:hypothetical protein
LRSSISFPFSTKKLIIVNPANCGVNFIQRMNCAQSKFGLAGVGSVEETTSSPRSVPSPRDIDAGATEGKDGIEAASQAEETPSAQSEESGTQRPTVSPRVTSRDFLNLIVVVLRAVYTKSQALYVKHFRLGMDTIYLNVDMQLLWDFWKLMMDLDVVSLIQESSERNQEWVNQNSDDMLVNFNANRIKLAKKLYIEQLSIEVGAPYVSLPYFCRRGGVFF